MNLNELLDAAIVRWPENPAIIADKKTVSYSELGELIGGLVRRLETLSLLPGSRVGLHLPDSVSYIALTYALWRMRTVVVPIPVECPAGEIADIARQMELSVVISSQSAPGMEEIDPGVFFTRIGSGAVPDNHGLNIAFIRFTSGTTSARKGVVLCHETVHARIISANKVTNLGPKDVVMWNLPMAHHFLITIVLYLSNGTAIVLARHMTPRTFIAEVNRHHATLLYSAPRFFGLLALDHSGVMMPSVRMAISTTTALTEAVAVDFHRRFNLPLCQALGVIELGMVAANTKDSLARWSSVGTVAGDMHVRLLNVDAEGCGELVVSGPGILDAYAAPWVPREQILREGWFHTGDVARMDDDGHLQLLSRSNSVINRAGQKIFPEEVEAVINRFPGVRESRVFGRKHERLGETVEAELVLANGQINLEELREFCREQLAGHKIPLNWNIVSELPRTAVTGKILRVKALLALVSSFAYDPLVGVLLQQ